MKRRRAIELIAAATTGAILLPSCSSDQGISMANFNISAKENELISALSNKLLPIPEDMIMENVSPTQFLYTMVDDCHSPEDIGKFSSGLSDFQSYLKKEAKTNISDLDLSSLSGVLDGDDDKGFFLKMVRRYAVDYYSGLEEYLNTYTDYKFIPGGVFSGCVNV